MKIAVAGCCHGKLDTLYEAIEENKLKTGVSADCLLCCGDFQAIRNEYDLDCLACPKIYRKFGDFEKYYNGTLKAPVLTIFIGGNHEASNILQELYYGGWVAPNIFYLGHSGIIRLSKDKKTFIRIAGQSGIYKKHDYNKGILLLLICGLKGYYETIPLNQNTIRSIYHVRKFETDKLAQISKNDDVDIFMSHDWPREFGDKKKLLQQKPYFSQEIKENKLGSVSGEYLLNILQPKFWFSAHLHTRFDAKVIDKETGKITQFLALDKPLPRRQYIEFIDLIKEAKEDETNKNNEDIKQKETNEEDKEAEESCCLYFDEEWLSILKNNIDNIPFSNMYVNSNIRKQSSFETCKFIKEKITKNSQWPKWRKDYEDYAFQQKELIDMFELKNSFKEMLENNLRMQTQQNEQESFFLLPEEELDIDYAV